jgi:hypothetical protein
MEEVSTRADNDRAELALFAAVCGTRARPINDDYANRHLLGRFGRIYATGIDGAREFALTVGAELEGFGAGKWNNIKAALAGCCRLTQDGDCEGVFLFDRLPSAKEGAAIRKALGLPKRREISEQERQRLRELSSKVGFKAGKLALVAA